MILVADESCDFTIVRTLRKQDFEVYSIAESFPGVSDREVLAIARRQDGILITEDKDFGRLVHISGENPHPVLLLRYAFPERSKLIHKLIQLLTDNPAYIEDSIIAIEPGKIRVRKYR